VTAACGVWPAPRGLVAVLVDGDGRSRSCGVALTDDARAGLALWLAAAGADLVVDEALLEVDPIAHVARRAGVTVWITGPLVVAALRHAAGITRRGARPSAALLARLPAIPWLRSLLRRLEPPGDERQIPLL
jgi:hypothetical protein